MKGRCLCRAVQYEIEPPIISCAHCHCESCRRASSAAFVTWATVDSWRLRITSGNEKLIRYESSPGAFRIFCGTCGSQLFMEYKVEPESIYVTVGSLNSPKDVMPDRHFSFEERVVWFAPNDALPKYRGKSGNFCSNEDIGGKSSLS